jgi:transcriptional regulator with XRE-family HTH domain
MHESFGARLRNERERRKIDLNSIVENTKISLTLLQGLERDDISRWPSGIFRKSFLRSYAAAIGLDPDVVLKEFLEVYPDASGPRLSAAPVQSASTEPPKPPRLGGLAWLASMVSSLGLGIGARIRSVLARTAPLLSRMRAVRPSLDPIRAILATALGAVRASVGAIGSRLSAVRVWIGPIRPRLSAMRTSIALRVGAARTRIGPIRPRLSALRTSTTSHLRAARTRIGPIRPRLTAMRASIEPTLLRLRSVAASIAPQLVRLRSTLGGAVRRVKMLPGAVSSAAHRMPPISVKFTIISTGATFTRGTFLDGMRTRVAAAACDVGVSCILALMLFIVLGKFWTPLGVSMLCYYCGGIVILGNTPGVCLFAPVSSEGTRQPPK